jgi:hypothetical protein
VKPISTAEREPPAPRRGAPAWVVGLAVALLIGAAGAVARNLEPWYVDPVVVVRNASVVPTLTNQLVIGTGAGTPTGAFIGTSDQPIAARANGSGAVFVESPGTVLDHRASAIFYRIDQSGSDYVSFGSDFTTSSVVVHGTPATLVSNGSVTVVRWQGVDRKVWILQTEGIDPTAAMRLANALTSNGPTVRVSPRSALGRLQAVGTIDDRDRMEAVLAGSQAFALDATYTMFIGDTTSVAVRYPHAGIAIGTSLGSHAIELMGSTFPVTSHVTVHGHAAVEFDITTNSGPEPATLTTVMWPEGGRIIAVTATTPALAEHYASAVRPASITEWRQVVGLSSSATAG